MSGSWGTSTNWTKRSIPAACDAVVIPPSLSVNISSGAECFSIEIDQGGTIEINIGAQLDVWVDSNTNN